MQREKGKYPRGYNGYKQIENFFILITTHHCLLRICQLLTVFLVLFCSVFFFLQVIFEGIAGYSFTGDIAIDSVKINKGGCPGKKKKKKPM